MSPLSAERERPRVPNHEMVRVIGRGAYGEIWIARSLTGALRAVKIVDERTFENDKAFQREFDGMARFEPISRSDTGFVDILHVGRDDDSRFFYYVMELADDATGESVGLEEYVPKTLRTELRRRPRLPVQECVAIGLSLTRALGVLHRHGLVHRDIKPANIIFVGGVPKIADIGLVAAHGQGSFVGTEGFVPPEGPGTPQADLFSLGKVLYEMAMGKDRLDFPALRSDLTKLPERQLLLRMNEVLLRACAPDPRERYASADELHEDLERVRDGRTLARRRGRARPVLASLAAAAALGGGGWGWVRAHQPGGVMIESDPPGAMVVLVGGGPLHRSPARFEDLPAGAHTARVMLPGYDPCEIPFKVSAHTASILPPVHLVRSHGRLDLTSTPTGAQFTLLQNGKPWGTGLCPASLADLPTGEYEARFSLGGCTESRPIEVTRDEPARLAVEFVFGTMSITSEPAGASVRVDGQPSGNTPVQVSLAKGPHEIRAAYRDWPALKQAVQLDPAHPSQIAFAFPPGTVKITSAPTGAAVLADGHEIGRAPLLLQDLAPGKVAYELQLPGYQSCALSGEVKPGEQLFLGGRLAPRSGPQLGQPWENSLHMKFAPVGRLLVGLWPVRVRDYDVFCQASGHPQLLPDFPQDENHPVVRVNWEDATAFCEWLTEKETRAGLLEPGQAYRLPTDREWSEAAGLPAESGTTPEERDGKLPDYPWGRQWPPPTGAGNYADATLKRGAERIPGYRDGFAQTSPVASFPANRLGLFDMGGNVWQWVQDPYKGGGHSKDWGVLRGGSWATSKQAELRASYRNVMDRTERDVIFGFRVVLVPEPEL